jgi:hypothetical protein
VPKPERLTWHKLLVSETRNDTSDKKTKDVEQAAVLVAALAEREPAALEEAFRDLSASARTKTRRAARRMLARLEETGSERAAELVRAILG